MRYPCRATLDYMGAARRLPIFGPILEAGLYDPHDAPSHTNWCPHNQEAAELASCLEACKQVIELQPAFSDGGTSRAFAMLATPVYSLAEHTQALQRLLAGRPRADWPVSDVNAFIGLARDLRKQLKALKPLRDKLGAHCDSDAVGPRAPVVGSGPAIVLPPLRSALSLLILALNHNATFGYYRIPDPDRPDEIQLTIDYPIATMFRLGANQRPIEILNLGLTSDPRCEASVTIRNSIDFHNILASSCTPTQTAIELTERSNPAKAELATGEFQARIL